MISRHFNNTALFQDKNCLSISNVPFTSTDPRPAGGCSDVVGKLMKNIVIPRTNQD
jgi:hypothetical protein